MADKVIHFMSNYQSFIKTLNFEKDMHIIGYT